jgi:hypothetical protein
MELEVSIPFNAGHAPLVRAVLLHEANRAVLIFVAHHSIADGHSIAFVIRDLLLRREPIRIYSPIDTRKLLGLGEDSALLIDAAVVAIEPHTSTDFWDIARQSMAGLGEARTLKGIFASRIALNQIIRVGIDVPTVAAIIAQAFAHEILLTNLGNLPYRTDFGELKLEAVWGPAVSARIEGALTIGVATTNGAICLLETQFNPTESHLKLTEQILVLACGNAAMQASPFSPIRGGQYF